MNKFVISAVVLVAGLVQSCSQIPDEAHFTRGQPESLLSVNAESVIVDLGQRNSTLQLTNYINSAEPNHAIITCSNTIICQRAETVLSQNNIPYEVQSGGSNSVELVSEQVVARDCDNRYVDNRNNPYNLNHPTFGCSMAMNQAMMVRDKRQFTDPLVLGPYDGFKAAQNYDTYLGRDTGERIIQAKQESITTGN